MPVTDIPGIATRGCVIEVFEPALTQLDADIVIDRFELGAGETRKDYVIPSRNTSYRYSDESLEELNEKFPIGGPAAAPEEPTILPHSAAEQEAGRARLQELKPAYEAIDAYNAEQGVETAAERSAKWLEDVNSIKDQDLPEAESYRILNDGRMNSAGEPGSQTGVVLTDEDYEGSEGSSKGTKQAGRTRNADKTKPKQLEHQAKAEEARKKAQEQRRQESHQ